MEQNVDALDANAYQSFFAQIQEEIVKYSNSLKEYVDLSEDNPYYEFFSRIQDEVVKYSKSLLNKFDNF